MARVLVDSSAVYALLDRSDANHAAARAILIAMRQRRVEPLEEPLVRDDRWIVGDPEPEVEHVVGAEPRSNERAVDRATGGAADDLGNPAQTAPLFVDDLPDPDLEGTPGSAPREDEADRP